MGDDIFYIDTGEAGLIFCNGPVGNVQVPALEGRDDVLRISGQGGQYQVLCNANASVIAKDM